MVPSVQYLTDRREELTVPHRKFIEELTRDGVLLWTKEALRRRDEVRSGRVQTIPGAEAMERMKRASQPQKSF